MERHDIRKKPIGLFLAVAVLFLTVPLRIGAALSGRTDSVKSGLQQAASFTGDVERGRRLFMGTLHLQNGGPPCMGCHNIDNNGLLGGGALGPDLTEVSRRYSQTGLAQALASIPWPTMAPIFTDHPLAPQEQADLLAFMAASAGQPASNREPFLWALSLSGLLAAAVLFGFYYRRRLRSVRARLVKQVQGGVQGKSR